MRQLHYVLVDVFTDVPFGGNQLAVFTDPGDLSTDLMQTIARELNLSESVFIYPPIDPQNHFKLRIFTPRMELAFAGHPTVGTGFVLHRLGKAAGRVLLEENVGVIPIEISAEPDKPVSVMMEQPIPQFKDVYEDRAAIAAMLSLKADDLIDHLPVQAVSAGVPFTLIPIKSLDAIRRVRVRLDLWEQLLRDSAAPHIFTFTSEVEQPGSTVHSRMFAPAMGIPEDPATGAAAGPLGAYLLRYGLATPESAQHITNEQGIEMGRPSIIRISVTGTAEHITRVTIGGVSVFMGEGVLYVDGV